MTDRFVPSLHAHLLRVVYLDSRAFFNQFLFAIEEHLPPLKTYSRNKATG